MPIGGMPSAEDVARAHEGRVRTIKAIETRYKGYLFRSRLEARWAIFFEEMGIKFHYEPEGFDLDGIWYLPDFWLPQAKVWAEVKPFDFTNEEMDKCKRLVKQTGYKCLLLVGPPDFVEYPQLEHWPHVHENEFNTWGVTLWTEYLDTEHRFFYQSFCDTPECFGEEYRQAVYASREARFDG